MTNRERVLQALAFERGDRTPYQVDFTMQMLEKMVRYSGRDDYAASIGNHITQVSLSKPEEALGYERFMDEFGVVWNKSGVDKDIGVVDGYRLADTESLKDYAMPAVDERFIRRQMEKLRAKAEGNFTVAGIGFSLFERAWTLRGMENLLCDMLEEPDFVDELMQRITQRNLAVMDIALEYDFDAFYFGDDWGQQQGMIMGPKCWRRFIKPCLARLYERAHKAGRYVVQHSCGDIRAVMDELGEIGLNVYQTFQPEIYGLGYAGKLRGRIAVWGGISTQRALPQQTPAGIRETTRALLAAFPEGGLIAGPTHAAPGDIPPENIEAMLQVLRGR